MEMVRIRRLATAAALIAALGWVGAAKAQVPGLPGTPPAAPASAADESKAAETDAPTADNPEATIAEAPGKIDVSQEVDESGIKDFLETTLPKYQGVYGIQAEVDGNVVTLNGHVEDDAVRDKLRDVALKVQGVVFVINKVKTDAQVLSASELVAKRLRMYGSLIAQNWLLVVLAIGMFVGSLAVARLFGRYGETLLRPLTPNALLRSVLVSLISAAIILVGIFSALQVFKIAEAVLSVLGLAGVAALAVGFAFRDIAENFIASILLGARRPFKIGDYVQVAGQAGLVQSLNTRATVLVTLEGKHVRIPNATVFKEVTINSTASGRSRGTFDVLVPYEVSTARALEAIGRALKSHDALLDDPPARALVEELTSQGVKLRAYFWFPSKGVDGFKILSDARLRVKVALQEAGIGSPVGTMAVSITGPIELRRDGRANDDHPHQAARAEQARDALRADADLAARADGSGTPSEATERVLDMAGGGASAEGENLLKTDGSDPEPAAANGRDGQTKG